MNPEFKHWLEQIEKYPYYINNKKLCRLWSIWYDEN